MTKPTRIAFAVLGLLYSAVAFAANPPKVVFIGDYLTANWPLPNSTWVNLGYTTVDPMLGNNGGQATYWATQFQSQVVALHPDIVHIMVGAQDAAVVDDGTRPLLLTIYGQAVADIIEQAKAANIKVILGTTPAGSPDNIGITQMNALLETYGAANGIPVVNYADALCNCINSTWELGNGNAASGTAIGYTFLPGHGGAGNSSLQPLIAPNQGITPSGLPPVLLPTSYGYALMSQMVQNTIATLAGAKVRSGYLQNQFLFMGVAVNAFTPTANQNSVAPGNTLKFTPMGTYTDGVTRPMLNSSFAGQTGTWTSNNPSVMYVTQTGIAYALTPGQAWIFYTSPEGVGFSPWIMNVTSPLP